MDTVHKRHNNGLLLATVATPIDSALNTGIMQVKIINRFHGVLESTRSVQQYFGICVILISQRESTVLRILDLNLVAITDYIVTRCLLTSTVW